MNRYAVIMAGGSGTRFWPLSRRERPKQILKLLGEQTLLEKTVERILPLFPLENVLVVCNRSYAGLIGQSLPGLPPENILAEPVGRNTAPCIAWAAARLARIDPTSVMCVLPADHHIKDEQRFRTLVEVALKSAQSMDTMVTLGIIPTKPNTGYGYIRTGEVVTVVDGVALLRGEQFVEKPDQHTAEEYIAKGNYYWNSGMFVWQTRVIIEELRRHLPQIMEPLLKYVDERPSSSEGPGLEELFQMLPSVSIDYGVMEKSARVSVIRGDFGWNDVGSWDALDEILPVENGNVVIGEGCVLVDTKNCVVISKQPLVACLGVENLVIVAAGDAVLVADKKRAQAVRLIVDKLKDKELSQYL